MAYLNQPLLPSLLTRRYRARLPLQPSRSPSRFPLPFRRPPLLTFFGPRSRFLCSPLSALTFSSLLLSLSLSPLSSCRSQFLRSPPVALTFSAPPVALTSSALLPSRSRSPLSSRPSHFLRSPPAPPIISLLVKSPSSFPVPSSRPCPFPSHPVVFTISLLMSLSSFPFPSHRFRPFPSRPVAFVLSLPVSSYRLSGVLRSPPIVLDFSAPLPLPSLSSLPSHCLPSPRISPSLTRRSLPVALSLVAPSPSLSVTLPSLPVALALSPPFPSLFLSSLPSRRALSRRSLPVALSLVAPFPSLSLSSLPSRRSLSLVAPFWSPSMHASSHTPHPPPHRLSSHVLFLPPLSQRFNFDSRTFVCPVILVSGGAATRVTEAEIVEPRST
ncbi:unnamed protein product [Closterium sp. NIES-53]